MEAHSGLTLAIQHVESSASAAFKQTRVSDDKSLSPVAINLPYVFDAQPNTLLALRSEERIVIN
jgi:hypothetical protein